VTFSAAQAYRGDLGSREQPFSDADGDWIAVAGLLEQACDATASERAQFVADATCLSIESLGAARVDELSEREWKGLSRAASAPIVHLTAEMMTAGALNLAACTLDALLEADADLSDVDRGRIMARRASVEWRAGRTDEAADRYEHLGAFARKSKSNELLVRSMIGLTTVSQMRGNYPRLLELATRAAPLAEKEQLWRLAREAHNGITIASSITGRLSDALQHGWRVYELSFGNEIDEAESLNNLGQVLINAGRHAEARPAFLFLSSRMLPLRILLATLGGLAVASAYSGRPDLVIWAADELSRIDLRRAAVPTVAIAMLDVAIGFARIGHERAEVYRRSALDLATTYGLHEILIRAETLEVSASPALTEPAGSLTSAAQRVVRNLEKMEPAVPPEHVALALV